MSNYLKVKQGRVWLQPGKFQTYMQLLPYGMTGVTDPAGTLNAIREPSATVRGESVIADIVRGESPLPQFQLETRLQRTLNYMYGLKKCAHNFQNHLGTCDRPDNYYASAVVFHWERSYRGDMQSDRLALIEGDNTPIQSTVPFMAEVGPLLFDMNTEFLSARTITETEAATAIAMMGGECFEDCRAQEDAGENGYLATESMLGSTTNIANVYYTVNKGEAWTEVSATPFAAAMSISDILVIGTKANHRVIVANGTTRPGQHAQIAYADVTVIGTTSWVTVDVGTVDGQYIHDLLFLDWGHIYASTDDGYIYRSQDGGATWTAVYTAGAVDINKMAGLSNGTIWAVGNSNLTLYSNDYGESWDAITGPSAGIGDDNLAVWVTPDGTVFVGNNAGELYGSYDNGSSWTTLSLQGITPTSVVDIKGWGDSDLFVIANIAGPSSRVLRSIDGGASFKLWNLNLPTNSGLNAMDVVDPNMVFVAGEPQGGNAFISRTNSRLVGIH